jgi:hypothetical protein
MLGADKLVGGFLDGDVDAADRGRDDDLAHEIVLDFRSYRPHQAVGLVVDGAVGEGHAALGHLGGRYQLQRHPVINRIDEALAQG